MLTPERPGPHENPGDEQSRHKRQQWQRSQGRHRIGTEPGGLVRTHTQEWYTGMSCVHERRNGWMASFARQRAPRVWGLDIPLLGLKEEDRLLPAPSNSPELFGDLL